VRERLSVYISFCAGALGVYVSVFVCLCVCMCVCICVCMCVCVCISEERRRMVRGWQHGGDEREGANRRGVGAREEERSEIEVASARSAPRGLIFKSPLF